MELGSDVYCGPGNFILVNGFVGEGSHTKFVLRSWTDISLKSTQWMDLNGTRRRDERETEASERAKADDVRCCDLPNSGTLAFSNSLIPAKQPR